MSTAAFFAPCPRGLEAALTAELTALNAIAVTPAEGGVGFSGAIDLAYHVNLQSRLASRILWQVGQGPCRNEDELYALVRAIDWPRHFSVERSLRVDVAATRSPLTSTEFATLRIKDAVCDRFRDSFGKRPSIAKQGPDVRVYAHLTQQQATLYLDTSGEALFKRGYRRETEAAPLRENLAAGLLALAGWTPEQPLLDPMCGSGTIAIEAALITAGRAPGLARSFGFQKLAWYDGPTWQRIRQRAVDQVRPTPAAPMTARIFAGDIDAAAIELARRNLERARLLSYVEFAVGDVLQRGAPAPTGLLVTNPPYGIRLASDAALTAFYPKLGDALKQGYAGWSAYLFSGDTRLPKLIGLKPSRRIPLYNGPLECRLYRFDLVAGRPTRVPKPA